MMNIGNLFFECLVYFVVASLLRGSEGAMSLLAAPLLGGVTFLQSRVMGLPASFGMLTRHMAWCILAGWAAMASGYFWVVQVAIGLYTCATTLIAWWNLPQPIHVERTNSEPISDVLTSGVWNLPPLENQWLLARVNNGNARDDPLRDVRTYPHNIVPLCVANPNFSVNTYRIHNAGFVGSVKTETVKLQVCIELLNTLLTRSRDVVADRMWFLSEANRVGALNLPQTLDREIRLNTAAAAYWEQRHEQYLFDRRTLVAEERHTWAVLAVVGIKLIFSFIPLALHTIGAPGWVRYVPGIAVMLGGNPFRSASW